MEYETDKKGGLLERLRESPRTVSALIIILVVAAAIYAFSGENGLDQSATNDDNEAVETPASTEEFQNQEAAIDGASTTETPSKVQATPEAVDQATLMESARNLPTAQETESGYVETAQSGDGITHLARRAATRYLSDNNAGYTVTNEHRIFIEDYIQNRLGTEGLEVGEARTVNFDLMREAVAAAGQLNDQQLRNLSQYTSALAS